MEYRDARYFKDFFTDKPVKYILNKPIEPDDIDKYLDNIKNYVYKERKGITTSQLRNIFSEIKRIKQDDLGKLKNLRVNLAYISGRSEKRQMKNLCTLLDDLIKEVNKNNLENFKNFFEAIIAYHKYFGGK